MCARKQIGLAALVKESLDTRNTTAAAEEAQSLDLVNSLCDLWKLADKLEDIQLKNQAVNDLLQQELPKRRLVLPETIKKILTFAPDGSGLYRWTLDHLAAHASVDELQEMHDAQALRPDMVFELLKKVVVVRDKERSRRCPQYKQRCDYHEHPGGTKSCV